jgi:leader peptidase (prepilin peptidase)/N-methyltransferase
VTDEVWGAALGGAVGLVTGAAVPWLIRRLPEPGPPAEPVEGEPPKEPYVDLGSRPRLALLTALVSAVAGALVGWSVGVDWLLLLVLPLAPAGTLLAVVDLRTRLLPRVVVLPVTVAAVAYGVVSWPVTGDPDPLVRALVGMALAFGVFFVLWFVRSAGMGYGDVRLSAWLGFLLGYLGWAEYALGLYAGFLVFGVPGLLLAIVRRDRSLLKKAYPFGPFLLVGALLGILLGDPILGGLALG